MVQANSPALFETIQTLTSFRGLLFAHAAQRYQFCENLFMHYFFPTLPQYIRASVINERRAAMEINTGIRS